jgi:Mg-chelatase subunit ChlI
LSEKANKTNPTPRQGSKVSRSRATYALDTEVSSMIMIGIRKGTAKSTITRILPKLFHPVAG